MRYIAVLLLTMFSDAKHLRPHHPTIRPSSINPPTPSPSWVFSPEQYYYYAKLYYERAAFDYKFFPHSGPAFYNAQEDEAKAKFYQTRGKEEKAQMQTLSPK